MKWFVVKHWMDDENEDERCWYTVYSAMSQKRLEHKLDKDEDKRQRYFNDERRKMFKVVVSRCTKATTVDACYCLNDFAQFTKKLREEHLNDLAYEIHGW